MKAIVAIGCNIKVIEISQMSTAQELAGVHLNASIKKPGFLEKPGFWAKE